MIKEKELRTVKDDSALLNLLNSSSSLGGNQFVTFKIGDEEYGLEIKAVQEITGFSPLTKIPNSNAVIIGMFNLRGNVVPIMDPRIKFGLPNREHNKFSVFIIFKSNDKTVGMVVDNVSDVLNINKEDIQDTPDLTTSINTRFIKGIGKVGDKLVILLDIEKIFSENEMNIE